MILALSLTLLLSCGLKNNPHSSANTPFHFLSYDTTYPPPQSASDVFELSQQYPDTFNVNEKHPWEAIDFKTDYKKYMQTVLDYCLEGNTEVDFKVQDNKVRTWYHAPWLTYGLNGREYHHGLTRERPVPAGELLPQQNVDLENWAVGFYNAPGGYTIGKVWDTASKPGTHLLPFPEGTVSFKLLFTTGPVDKVPFLEGTKEWTANVYRCNPESADLSPIQKKTCIEKRYDTTVRLLQIDVAIKDKRAGAAGWVFGTFIYNGAHKGKTVWERMVPVGTQWGDDSSDTTLLHKPGAFINPTLKETVLNPELIAQNDTSNVKKAIMSHHGLGGRLNGPVDNPISSCISCHSKAAIQPNGTPAPMADFSLTRATFTLSAFDTYFSVINGGSGILTIKGQQYNKLDYSLQLAAGIRNYYQSQIDAQRNAKLQLLKSATKTTEKANQPLNLIDLPEVSRGGLINEN